MTSVEYCIRMQDITVLKHIFIHLDHIPMMLLVYLS